MRHNLVLAARDKEAKPTRLSSEVQRQMRLLPLLFSQLKHRGYAEPPGEERGVTDKKACLRLSFPETNSKIIRILI